MEKRHKKRNDDGVAMVLVILIIIAIGGALTFLALQGQRVNRATGFTVSKVQAEEAAKAGIDLALDQYWSTFGGGNVEAYQDHLNVFIPEPSEYGEESDEISLVNGSEAVSKTNPIILDNGARITALTVTRTDSALGSELVFRSTGSTQDGDRSVVQSVRIGGDQFRGFDFAILANNITCIVCHAEVLSIEQYLNTDPTLHGTFARAKIAALESLMIRADGWAGGAATNIAGSTYTRGRVYDHKQNPLNASQIESINFNAFPFSNAGKGNLFEDNNGNLLTPQNMVAAELDGNGLFEPFANLYDEYPMDKSAMTDGDLPTSFPPPFPDENGNRIVDDAEFLPFMQAAGGSVTGGVVHALNSGQTYGGTGLPTSSNGTALADGTHTGNVILVGTESNPIILNGDIAIDGDLVIQGVVKGKGKFQVRGNTYIVGDVTYADANGEFGQHSSDPDDENLLGIASGGNIMVGDYNTVRARPYDDHKDSRGRSTARDGFYSNRFANDRWIDYGRANKTAKDGNNVTQKIGYLDRDSSGKSLVADDGGLAYKLNQANANPVTSFTTGQLMLFNRMERRKADADPNYKPRYYQLRGTQPIWSYEGNEQHTDWYDNPNLEEISGSELNGAAILNLAPKNGWMSEEVLRNIWWADEQSRASTPRPFKLDGLLYTNNAIFAEVHSKEFHNSNTNGQMIIRGGIVAADLGILIPGKDLAANREKGLTMLYDPRVADFMPITDTTNVTVFRSVFRYET